MELNKFIIANDFFSLTVRSNKPIPLPEWFHQFLTRVPKKKNLNIKLLFNNRVNKTFISPEILFFLYDDCIFERFTITLETILNYFHKELNIFILHSSCLNINSHAYPFIGDPNTGKTTLVKAMKDYFKVIHDDKVIVHNFNFISPLPFSTHPNLITNKTVHIKELILINKSNLNHFCNISKVEARNIIYRNITTNINEEILHKFIKTHKIKLLNHYPFNKEELKDVLLKNDNSFPN